MHKHKHHLAALQKYLELKVLFCQCSSGPDKYLYLTLNLISVVLECKVALRKADLPTVQRFLSLQKMKLPVGVYWPDVPDQICHQWETLWGLLKRLKTSPIAGIAFLSCHSKGFFLSLHPPENVISQRGWDEWPHKTQIILGWKAAIGKKEAHTTPCHKRKYVFSLWKSLPLSLKFRIIRFTVMVTKSSPEDFEGSVNLQKFS